jgi:hypothetical protein
MKKLKKLLIMTGLVTILLISGFLVVFVGAADPLVKLPTDSVKMNQFKINYPYAFFDVWFSDIPEGDYDVANGEHYLGWCIDHPSPLPNALTYDVMLYSSYDPPAKFYDEDWDMVNYILNHKPDVPDSNEVVDSIQAAIRYFVNFGYEIPQLPGDTLYGTSLVGDALANGEGFIPGPGQIVAVIVDTNPLITDYNPYPNEDGHSYQYIIIEFNLFSGLTPGFWKNHHPDAWVDGGYDTGDTLKDTGFIIPDGTMDDNNKREVDEDDTLLEALNYKGGKGDSGAAQILLRAAVAALLNAADGEIIYPFSEDKIIADVNDALGSDRSTMLDLKDVFDEYNNREPSP